MGRFTTKAERQPKPVINSAPNDGPVATASAPTPPHSATTWERRLVGNAPNNSPSDEGNTAAAPTPWTRRPATSMGTDGASPHRADPKQKTASPAKNTRRLPSRSAVRPAMTSREPNTMPYPVITQARAERGSWGKDRSSAGKATLTMDRSSEA